MANKGEWTEPYVAIRILADGRLYLAGNDGHRNLNEWMDVLSLHRIESILNCSKRTNRDVKYHICLETGNVRVNIDDVFVKNIKVTRFQHIAEVLKNDITSTAKGAVNVSSEIQDFLIEAEIRSMKAKSIDKSDIFITIRDPRASIIRDDIGFSIKSEFGKDPTIFNTAKASAAKYRVSGMTDDLMNEINSILDNKGNVAVKERCQRLLEKNCELEFIGYPIAQRAGVAAFYENLDTINPRLVDVIERIMWYHFIEGDTAQNIPDVVENIIRRNPLGITNPETKYISMIKSFLYAAYCGMTASTIWNGDSRVKGGFISVNREGEVMAYYAMESDSFKTFLYDKCYVDYPSTDSGHGDYAKVYKENDEYHFNLNFQIKMHKNS